MRKTDPTSRLQCLPLIIHDEHGEIRLISFVDGYVVARRPGLMPMIKSIAEWQFLYAEGLARRSAASKAAWADPAVNPLAGISATARKFYQKLLRNSIPRADALAAAKQERP